MRRIVGINSLRSADFVRTLYDFFLELHYCLRFGALISWWWNRHFVPIRQQLDGCFYAALPQKIPRLDGQAGDDEKFVVPLLQLRD